MKKYFLYSVLLIITGCQTSSRYIDTNIEINENFPLQDFFKDNSIIDVTDFDTKGNVKQIIQYKATATPVTDSAKLNKDFEVFFDKKQRFIKRNIYHTGSYFFHGKVKTEQTVSYSANKKKFIEKDFSKDSSEVILLNVYNKKGKLIKTQNQQSSRNYLYNTKGRLLQEEINSINLKNPITYKYHFITPLHKTKERVLTNNLINTPQIEHFYYREDGTLYKRIIATSQIDSTLNIYNKKRSLEHFYKNTRGKPYRESIYTYNDDNLLIKEETYRRGKKIMTTICNYDSNKNPIKITSYSPQNKIELETSYSYKYDEYNNWTTQKMERKSGEKTLLNTIVKRKIHYWK